MHDTREEALRVLDHAVIRQSPAQRLARALQWSEDARTIALQALRERYPHESLLQLVERLTGEPMQARTRSGPLPAHSP